MNIGNLDNIRTDPSKSSIIENSLDLQPINSKDDNKFIDKNSKEVFYQIDALTGKRQQTLSLLLKGVINTVDIVKHKGDYFSHNQNINALEQSETDKNLSEIKADIYILQEVFGDHDRHVVEDIYRTNKENEGWEEHHNFMSSKDNSKKYYFDFERAFGSFSFYFPKPTKLNDISESWEEHPEYKEKVLKILKEKTDILLKTRFLNNTFFNSILSKTQFQFSPNNATAYGNIKSKLEDINNLVKKELQKII